MILDRRRIPSRACVVLSATLLASPVRAEPGLAMLVLRASHGDSSATERLIRDEFRFKGWRVDVIDDPGGRLDVADAIAEHGAIGAIRFSRQGGEQYAAEAWLRGAESEEFRLVRIVLPLDGPIAALKAAEQVAGVVDTLIGELVAAPTPSAFEPALVVPEPLVASETLPPAPSASALNPNWRLQWEAEPEPPAAAPEATPEPPLQFPGLRGTVGLRVALWAPPDGSAAFMGGSITTGWRWSRLLSLRTTIFTVASPVDFRATSGGGVRVGISGARAALLLTLREGMRVSPRLGVGGGSTVVWAFGRGSDALRGSRDLAALVALDVTVEVAVRLTPRVALVLGLDASFFGPPALIRVVDTEVGPLGLPMIQGEFGVEWRWSSSKW